MSSVGTMNTTSNTVFESIVICHTERSKWKKMWEKGVNLDLKISKKVKIWSKLKGS